MSNRVELGISRIIPSTAACRKIFRRTLETSCARGITILRVFPILPYNTTISHILASFNMCTLCNIITLQLLPSPVTGLTGVARLPRSSPLGLHFSHRKAFSPAGHGRSTKIRLVLCIHPGGWRRFDPLWFVLVIYASLYIGRCLAVTALCFSRSPHQLSIVYIPSISRNIHTIHILQYISHTTTSSHRPSWCSANLLLHVSRISISGMLVQSPFPRPPPPHTLRHRNAEPAHTAFLHRILCTPPISIPRLPLI